FPSPNLVDLDDTLTEFSDEPSLWEALPEQDLTFDDYVLVDTDIAVWGALSEAEIVALDHNNTESDENESEELTLVTLSEAKVSLKKLHNFFLQCHVDAVILQASFFLEKSIDKEVSEMPFVIMVAKRSRFQLIDDKEILGYTSQNTSLIGIETIENNFTKTQEFDSSRIHNFSQQQNCSHGEKSNSNLKCIYSNEEKWKLQQKRDQEESVNISVVGRCIRNACGVLYRMDYESNNILSQMNDSQTNNIFPSGFNLFPLEEETSALKKDKCM
ncbi:hypothetical protein TNCV_3399261, partial [Trichonephila clavipes]